jgi:hypothetical protein
VTNRDTSIFWASWLTTSQLDDDVAIVVLDGKEQFFDPGQRYCPFGQMAWKHTSAGGLREMEHGTALAVTPEPPYIQTQTQRIADLTLDADGTARGTLKITWMGAPALRWRQQALSEDEEGVKHAMRKWMEERIPAGLEPEVTAIDNLEDYEKPLVASFTVHGPLATVTAKRFILPGQFFEVNSKPRFTHPTRDIPVYFDYAGRVADAVRMKYPTGFQVESAPKEDTVMLQKLASYHESLQMQNNAVLMRRTYDLGTSMFLQKEYGDVRTFFEKMLADDQQPLVLIGTDMASATEKKDGQ